MRKRRRPAGGDRPTRISVRCSLICMRHQREACEKRPQGLNGIACDSDVWARRWQMWYVAAMRQIWGSYNPLPLPNHYRRKRVPSKGDTMIKSKCIVSTGSLKRRSTPGNSLCPAFPDMKTLRVSPAQPGSKAALESLQAVTARLPASLLRSGKRILLRASRSQSQRPAPAL